MDAAFEVWLEHIFYPGQNQLKKLGERAVMLKQPIHQNVMKDFFFNSSNDWLSEYLPK